MIRVKKSIRDSLVFLNLLAAAVAANTRVVGFQLPQASPAMMALFFSIVGLIIAIIIVALIRQEGHRRKKLEEHSLIQFKRFSKEMGLTDAEERELYAMAGTVVPQHPDAIFQSLAVFEEAVDKECVKLRHKWGLGAKGVNATLGIRTMRNKMGYAQVPYEQPLASSRNIEIGQMVQLLMPDTEKLIVDQAAVVEATELTLVVRFRVEDMKLPVDISKKHVLLFTRNGDGMYSAPVSVVSAYPSDCKVVYEHTMDLNRNQLRKFVRLVVDIPVKCRIMRRKEKNATPAAGQVIEDSKIVDICGGGVAFVTPQSLESGDLVVLSFALNSRKLSVKGRVIAVNEQEGRHEMWYKHRVAFEDAEPADIESIVKFIFQKQREQAQMFMGRR